MTGILSVSTATLIAVPVTSAAPAVNDSSVATSTLASPTTIVSLGQASTDAVLPTYTSRGVLGAVVTPTWEYTQQDKVSLAMASSFSTSSTASRFQGLGATLLAQLAEGGQNISQSVVRSAHGQVLSAAEVSAAQSKVHSDADSSFSLTIKTASGKTVQLTLSSSDNGLAVTADVSGGDLSDDERNALARMADGFQSAIDGLTANPPSLKLDALTQYDPNVFSSVDLQSELKIGDDQKQTLSFHADSDLRSVKMSGALGELEMNVDLKNAAAIGDASQQDKALKGYLKQIEAAKSRGNGDTQLLSMFEDAFSTLHSQYPGTRAASAPQTVNSIALTATDHAMLSGLADFSASVKQNTQAINPMRPDELDAFAYDLSQSTQTKGRNQLNRSVTQEQQSHLVASYHKPLYAGGKLDLTRQNESQNYLYYQVSDQASSKSNLTYEKGALTNASVTQSASQSTRISKYVMGHLEQDTRTPVSGSKTQNLLGALESALQQDKKAKAGYGTSWLKEALSNLHDKAQLESNPAKLRWPIDVTPL
jgi:hypothetical protein